MVLSLEFYLEINLGKKDDKFKELSMFQFSLENITLFTYLSVFFAGIFICLTPCVYPILPVVVGYLGGGKQIKTKGEAFTRSLSYVFGLACMYAILGAVAALSGGLFGAFQNKFWVNLIIGNIFIIMGLFMLEVFNFPQINIVQSNVLKDKTGVGGAFLVGAVSGLVIGPCTTPVLAGILAFVASRQNILLGISLLFTYALGMGAPLLLLGTFIGLLRKLPKSGEWLVKVKKIFGFLLIASGEYFLIGLR